MQKKTTFRYDILATLAELTGSHGLGVKSRMEERFDRYDGEVNHGRLYPNLNELVDEGLLAKEEIDGRTNEYRITEEGRRVVQKRITELAGDGRDR